MTTTSRITRRSLLGFSVEVRAAKITSGCLAHRQVVCASCFDVCESGAIRFSGFALHQVPAVVAERCTGCRACVGICPVNAIVLGDGSNAAR